METFKSSTDPELVDKVTDIVDPYLDRPQDAIVLCVDEKSQIPGTPDATTTELEVLWIPGGMAILRQDGATRPATYLGPLQSTD